MTLDEPDDLAELGLHPGRDDDSGRLAGGDDRFHILTVLEGAIDVPRDQAGEPVQTGQTILLPAAIGQVKLTPHGKCILLDMYLP